MERLVTFEQFAEQKAKQNQVQLEQELNAKREASANSFKNLLAEFGVASMDELSEEDRPKFNERLGALTESALLLEGTRSQVGKIDKNGKITSTYVHYDGYPEYMLPVVKKYDAKGVDQLLDLGKAGISVLDKEIGKKQDFNNPKRGWTLFYGRDRGENNNMISTGNAGNIKAYLKDMANNSSAEYVYLYDERDGNWYYADAYGDTTLTLVESLSEAVAISGKRTANKVALRLNKLFTDKLTAIAADKVTMLGFLKELYFSAMEDANFGREAGISMNMIKGKLGPLEVKVAGLDNEAIKISAKTVKLMVDKYYTDLANAGDWSGIGITEGFAMYLDQIGESVMAQALIDSFNAQFVYKRHQFEGEEKRVSRTERLYEFSQKNVEEDRAEEIEDDGVEMANEAEIKSDDEFKEYAFTVLQKAFGEDFDEAKAQEVVDGILGKADGDYGKAAGILQASLG